jgi:hypothetical protein
MKALDCVRNAVFTELIEVASALTDAETPATAIATVEFSPFGGASNPDPAH